MLVFKGACPTLIVQFSGINLHGQKISLVRKVCITCNLFIPSKLSPNEHFHLGCQNLALENFAAHN